MIKNKNVPLVNFAFFSNILEENFSYSYTGKIAIESKTACNRSSVSLYYLLSKPGAAVSDASASE